MALPLDHLVLGVQDLDAAGRRFAALGFTVGATNLHPWGTANRIIQFADETFLELIAIAAPGLIPPHAPRHFSFGAFVRDGLSRAPGLSMLALKSAGAAATAAAFAKAGIGDFSPFDFSRKGQRADGSAAEVAFSLAFAADPALPACGFFVCQQHFPHNFWSKIAQDHANGAASLARVTLVAENPSDHHIFLSAFAGARALRATSFGIEAETGPSPATGARGAIEIVTREGFIFRYGVPAPAAGTPAFAGFELVSDRLDQAEAHARDAGIALVAHAEGLTLPASADFLTALRFTPSGPAR